MIIIYPWLLFSFAVVLQLCSSARGQDGLYGIEVEQLFPSVKLELHSDEDSPKSDSPWSYEPVCTAEIKSIGSALCVYTQTHFSDGRGISLFTTPDIARQILASSPFNTPSSLADSGSNIPQDSWFTKPVPGKGIGVFAKKPIPRGQVVTANTPVLVVYSETFLPKAEREALLRLATDQLPPSSRDALLSLSKVFNNPEIPIQDIIAGNAFGLEIGAQAHLAVFPEVSRVNHDCSPNSQFYLDSDSLTHFVRAVRPIAENEEVTIAYSNPLAPFSERQKALFKGFHFKCGCSRCLRGEAADIALQEIAELQSILSNWTPASKANVKVAERLVKLYAQEGLEGYADPAYCHVALTYSAAGSARGARKYYDLALESHQLRLGPMASDLGACNGMKDNIEKHWSWRRRKSG
ncbi:hypothetical protein B0A52_03763 [Exophiala mesophila]|uniref:SET domain-containing protein n=1 Tax=Exophiala mesophila TaxID=212818 RepID=A0A438N7G5_EXOME|nr:hypothetical protein B0A52_03763 [Exophiala mesophila]